MTRYHIMTDSSCDLPATMAEELDVTAVPLSVLVQDRTYANYLDEREITFRDFYELLRHKVTVTTAAVNSYDFSRAMETLLRAGQDILYLGFSSALSGTFSAGASAARELRDKYPQRKIIAIDTLCASLGQGLLVYLTAMEQRRGSSLEKAAAFAESMKLKICHWFTVEDLFHLKRGGRISAATAALGSLLSIRPVMKVDNSGRLVNVDKARGRQQAIKQLVRQAAEHAEDLPAQTVFISHGDCEADARQLEGLLYAAGARQVVLNPVGPVIGAHAGPGTLALFFVGDER